MKILNLTKSRILLFQNNNSGLICSYLQQSGFEVMNSDSLSIKENIKEQKYDLCILDDFRMPNGLMTLELLEYTRSIDAEVPIIIASSNPDYTHIISAFNKGADDYVLAPLNLDELVCRVNAILKRTGERHIVIEDFYKIGDYYFDVKQNILTYKGSENKLPFMYGYTLAILCSLENRYVSFDTIRKYIGLRDERVSFRKNKYTDRSISVGVCNLKKCLKMDSRIQIRSERGLGYCLTIASDLDELM